MTEKQYKGLLSSISNFKTISISLIQRAGYGFITASNLYKEFIKKGFIDEKGKVNKANIYKEIGREWIPEPKLLFLDIDGVLNCRSTKDKISFYKGIEDKKVALLKDIVDKSCADIILVSSWKENWFKDKYLKDKQDECANYLDEKLSKYGLCIKDKTDEYNASDRGDAIKHYVAKVEHQCGETPSFVILDDEMFDYKQTKLTKYLVQTSYDKNGLTRKHADKAIEILNR